VTELTNLFVDLPEKSPEELFQTLMTVPGVRIERIVSHGHASPPDFWYDQTGDEWVLVLRGSARLEFTDRIQELQPGDFVLIPAGVRHRVAWTTPEEPTIWLAVHLGEP